jgi:hypothetical protein
MINGFNRRPVVGGIASGGAAAAGGSYEYVFDREMKRIEQDLKDGKIDQKKFEIRKDKKQRTSLLE